MKSSYQFVILCFFLFSSCEEKPKRLLVRPLEKSNSDSIYSTIFPFDTHPSLPIGKYWKSKKIQKEIPDTLFTHRIRVNQVSNLEYDAQANIPAVPVEVILPDSVRLGDGFYYLLVLKARDGAVFSKMHLKKKEGQQYEVRVFQQEAIDIPKPFGEMEETLRSFFPLERGLLEFQYFYYDSLLMERQVVVY